MRYEQKIKKRKPKTFWGIYVGHNKQDYGRNIMGRYITLDWKYTIYILKPGFDNETPYALKKGLQRMLIY